MRTYYRMYHRKSSVIFFSLNVYTLIFWKFCLEVNEVCNKSVYYSGYVYIPKSSAVESMANFVRVLPTLCWFLVYISSNWYWQVDAFKGTVFQFTHEVSLSSEIKVRWTTKDPEWITFEMSSPTTGYIGIGFSHTGSMTESDIYIGWVDSSGTAHVKVMHTPQLQPHNMGNFLKQCFCNLSYCHTCT